MRRCLPLFVFAAMLGGTAYGQQSDHMHHHEGAPSSGDAQIVVTINPEARVSVARGVALPPPTKCATPITLVVKIFNQGSVTAPLIATIVGSGAKHVTLHMESNPLTGHRDETRTLHLIPIGTDPADVTISFEIAHNIGDFGDHDRVNFLVRCINPTGS